MLAQSIERLLAASVELSQAKMTNSAIQMLKKTQTTALCHDQKFSNFLQIIFMISLVVSAKISDFYQLYQKKLYQRQRL